MRGSTPTTALLTIRANGFKLYDLIAFSLANKIAAAPSFKPEALPAVTVPSLRKEGFNFVILLKLYWLLQIHLF